MNSMITDKLVLRSYSTKIMPKKRALAPFDWRISYRKCVLKNPKKIQFRRNHATNESSNYDSPWKDKILETL